MSLKGSGTGGMSLWESLLNRQEVAVKRKERRKEEAKVKDLIETKDKHDLPPLSTY